MSQTSFSINMSAYGYEGQLADAGFTDKISASAEVAVPMGKLVVRGTDPAKQGKLPTAAGDIVVAKILGVSLHDQAREQKPANSAIQYEIKDSMSLLRSGRIVVKVEETVVAGDVPSVRHAAGGLGIGSFAKTADANRAALPNAVYVQGASANGLAVVEISYV